MSQNGSISLRESLPSDISQQEHRGSEQNVPNINQADSRRLESNMKKASVLLGSAILQLPIWGMLIATS
jgi:hypothetical protein